MAAFDLLARKAWSRRDLAAAAIKEADLVIDLCTPHADALIAIDGVDTPVGPGSTIAAVAVANSIKVRTAQLLAEQGALPPTITRASVVGAERSRALFDAAYQEHARRIARVIAGRVVSINADGDDPGLGGYRTSREIRRDRPVYPLTGRWPENRVCLVQGRWR